MKYLDFINLNYIPQEDDLICTYYVEPDGLTISEAAGGIAAESSIGTWTEISTLRSYVKDLAAKVFKIDGNIVHIAYPVDLFEEGNMPNILSSVAGNIFGLKGIKNLRLLEIKFPYRLVRSFMGPRFGIFGVREILGVRDRPLIGTIIKPKLGLKTSDHAKVAYEAWLGGCDIVKDDENLSGQSFNRFEERVVETLKARDKAENDTGERKVYLVNVTAETMEMIRRAKFVKEHGGRAVMVDILTCGFAALQTLREADLGLIIHAHRAGHAAFTRNPRHGISMKVIAKISRIIGVDQLHVGTVVGKMYESKEDVLENIEALKENLYGLKSVFPVASGGLHPALIPEIIKYFGVDVIIQAGGGIHGHSLGTVAGAKAMRQAVDAVLKGVSLDEYAKSHLELRLAIEKWVK